MLRILMQPISMPRLDVVIRFEPVALDAAFGDNDGMLVYCENRLLAVLSCLGPLHDELAGRWFIEASFRELGIVASTTFETLDHLETTIREVL